MSASAAGAVRVDWSKLSCTLLTLQVHLPPRDQCCAKSLGERSRKCGIIRLGRISNAPFLPRVAKWLTYSSSSGKHTVVHVSSQSTAHYQIHGKPAGNRE